MNMRPADNPFRSACVDRLAFRYVDGDAETVWRRLEAAGHRGLIVGPMGSGKTTLCDALCGRYDAAGQAVLRLRLAFGQRRPTGDQLRQIRATAGTHPIVMMDGIEQLSAFGWWRLRRAVGPERGLVATSHAPGRLPLVHRTRTSPALLHELTRDLLAAQDGDLPAARLDALYTQHDGDIRQCLRSLYDDFSGRSASA